MTPVRVLTAIFLGGCIGGAARHLLASSAGSTLAVNLLGSAVLGLLVVAAPHHWRPLVGTGFCGALTTFGTVMVLVRGDLAAGRPAAAVGYLCLSLLGGVACAGLGVALGHRLTHRAELAPEDPDVEVE